jgi:hypothetical protein
LVESITKVDLGDPLFVEKFVKHRADERDQEFVLDGSRVYVMEIYARPKATILLLKKKYPGSTGRF